MSGLSRNGSALVIEPSDADAFAWCRDITRREARNFYYGLRLTPEPRRSAIYSVYAWMRAADDIVDDESMSPGERRLLLDEFRARTEEVISGSIENGPGGGAWDHRLWRAFGATLEAFELDPDDFRDVFEGFSQDLADAEISDSVPKPRYRSRSELESYCYAVASTVGIICVRIWGTRDGVDPSVVRSLAAKRGLAFQLTNILRDLADDYAIGRVYVPGEDFDRHALSPEDLATWSKPAPCTELVRELGDWSRRCYRESGELDHMLVAESAPAMWAMTRIYSDLLDVILREPAKLFSGDRVRLPGYQKAAIGIRAMVRARRSRA